MRKQIRCRVFAVIVMAFFSLAVSAQRYPIRMDPQEKAGQKYHLVAMATNKTTREISVSGLVVKQEQTIVAVELSADVIILEAGSNNWATRKRFTVLSSKVTRGSSTGPLLPNGTQVTALIQNGETVYEVDQKPVDEDITTALRAVITLHLASVADDDMFGTPTPKKIGESWAVNIDATKKLLKEIGTEGGRQEITGTGKLERVEKNHTFVRSSISVRDVFLPILPELKTESGEIRLELWGRFPVRRQDRSEESNGKLYMSRSASGVNSEGKEARAHVVYERTSRYEIHPM